MLKYIFLLLPLIGNSQKLPQIKVAYLGDSYCNGCCAPYDNTVLDRPGSYRYRLTQWLKTYYDTVITLKRCVGGENIRNAMPYWYVGTKPGYNIDDALNWGADLIMLQYSGNHFYNGIRVDTVKMCYQYLYDTLTSLGKNFIFVSNMPRKVALGPGLTPEMFQDSAREVNRFLIGLDEYRYNNVFDTTYDPVSDRPIFSYLSEDSLHWNETGYAAFLGGILMNSPIIDSVAGFDQTALYNLMFTPDTDSILINFGYTKVKSLAIATSDDGITYTVRDRVTYKEGSYSKKVGRKPYVRIEAIRWRRRILLTKRFDP